jgi:myo-inositol 2-dehydrogenase/D-chiro-inositol 1-dehydrogenase
LDDGQRVLDAWKDAGVVGMMGFNYRFSPLYREVKRQLDAGRLGALVAVRSVFSTAARGDRAWRGSRDRGGGVLLDLASHHVDLLRFLLGQEVHEVSAALHSQRSEDDTAMVQLRFADGLLTQSFFSLSAVEDDRLDVYGEAGRLTVDRYLSLEPEIVSPTRASARLQQLRHGVRSLARAGYAFDKLRAPGHEPSYAAALAHFVAAVRGECVASPDVRDGYHSLATVDAAERSARSGRAVLVERDRSVDRSEPVRDGGRWRSSPRLGFVRGSAEEPDVRV